MKWVKASDHTPETYPVNATSELHYKLDGRKVDGFFLHSRCFEYFDPSISGYRQLESEDFGRIEYLDETQTPSKEAGFIANKIVATIGAYVNGLDRRNLGMPMMDEVAVDQMEHMVKQILENPDAEIEIQEYE